MKSSLCPCRDCRPAGETLKQAIKRINYAAACQRYGKEGADAREQAKRERLAELAGRASAKPARKTVRKPGRKQARKARRVRQRALQF